MSLQVVNTTKAPKAAGPYVQAIKLESQGLLFASGCIGLDPEKQAIVEGGVEAQAEQSLSNLKAVVEAGGSEMSKVVKTTVFLTKMSDFAAINKIYEKHFGDHRPARSCVAVAELPLGALFEVEAIVSLQ